MKKSMSFLEKNKAILLLLILVLSNTLAEIGRIDWSIDWVKNVEIWINEFIMAIFAYQLSSFLLKKIKIALIRETISFIIALFVSNSIVFDYSYIESQNTKQWIFFAIRIVITIVGYTIICILGYEKGRLNGEKELYNNSEKYKEKVRNMPTEQKSLIYNCYALIKKHKEKIELIEALGGIEAIENFVRIDKEIKKQK